MKKQKGFTLIEIVIVIAILGLVSLIGSVILHGAFESANTSKDAINASWQARLALARMSSELREIRSATSSDLNISSNNQISFTDVNGNNISYTSSGDVIFRNGTEVADDITALTFSYYNANNVITANVNNVRCIKAEITAVAGSNSTNIQTVICPRNLL